MSTSCKRPEEVLRVVIEYHGNSNINQSRIKITLLTATQLINDITNVSVLTLAHGHDGIYDLDSTDREANAASGQPLGIP